MDMPPIPLHASTQADNYDSEKIIFLGKSGFKRIVLARELTLQQIKEIRGNTDAELEVFVHGSLCVSMSGRCYMSQSVGGRSANRGACAQPCRKLYSLEDENGRVIIRNKHLLSLKDLSLAGNLGELLDAGVSSFKIEGRMKEADYVANITAYYSEKIDEALKSRPATKRSSAGFSRHAFLPDPSKSFNRGLTDYFIHGRKFDICSPDTPKSLGERIGKVLAVTKNSFELEGEVKIGNNDGLMFIGPNGESRGIKVNTVEGKKIFPDKMEGLRKGDVVYRNYDHSFQMLLEKNGSKRYINVDIELKLNNNILLAKATTERGLSVEMEFEVVLNPARDRQKSEEEIIACFRKSGDTPFVVGDVDINDTGTYFFRTSELNGFRRALLYGLRVYLENLRETYYPVCREKVDCSSKSLGYEANVSNSLARKFYKERGAAYIAEAFELMENTQGLKVMTTKHCLKYFAGYCPKYSKGKSKNEPQQFYLSDGKKRYSLEFDCGRCEMHVYS